MNNNYKTPGEVFSKTGKKYIGNDKELLKTVKEILDTEGPIDSVKLRKFLEQSGLSGEAKEYRKNIPVILIDVEKAIEIGLPVGTVDNLGLDTPNKIRNYVKNQNNGGKLAIQITKEGKIDAYAIGGEILEKKYEKVDIDNEINNIDPRLKQYLEKKGINLKNLEIVKKNEGVLMLNIKDIEAKFPEIAEKLKKEGIVIKAWGNFAQEVTNDGYIVLDGNDNAYTVAAEENGYPIGYEPVKKPEVEMSIQ